MTCERCGARCHGDRCEACETHDRVAAMAVDFETFDCPTCEGATSGPGVECYRCRGEQ